MTASTEFEQALDELSTRIAHGPRRELDRAYARVVALYEAAKADAERLMAVKPDQFATIDEFRAAIDRAAALEPKP